MAFDRDKFKQLVHYFICQAVKRDWFSAVKSARIAYVIEPDCIVVH